MQKLLILRRLIIYNLNIFTIWCLLLKRGSTQKWKFHQLWGYFDWSCRLYLFFPASIFLLAGWPDAGPYCVMQVLGCCDAGPRMLRCRCPDVHILATKTMLGKVGALLGKINVMGWICGQLSSLSKVFIFTKWTLSLKEWKALRVFLTIAPMFLPNLARNKKPTWLWSVPLKTWRL